MPSKAILSQFLFRVAATVLMQIKCAISESAGSTNLMLIEIVWRASVSNSNVGMSLHFEPPPAKQRSSIGSVKYIMLQAYLCYIIYVQFLP